ncbi:MAG: flagellar type III secretion system protein FliQ, partial [Nitrospirae bacterium]|nr:flagellar type III secretion system protein FliQ [Nitrospirota bacterium]
SLIVGLAVSALQAMTQLNEATLTFVPKVLTIFGAIVVFMPWVLGVMTTFMTELFTNIPNYVH